jgi:HTH-type transcriptional regulator, fmd operon transcriptional regulator
VRSEIVPHSHDTERSAGEIAEFKYPGSSLGFLTKKQFQILCLRDSGYLQREIALQLHMSRSSVSMIEARARGQINKARQTLRVFELSRAQTQHIVTVEKGTRLQKIPMIVLEEADRFQIHLRSNMVDILRMVKKLKGDNLADGRTRDKIVFVFNERGKLALL